MARRKFTTLEDIQNNCECEPNTGCWLWMGSVNGGGYCQLRDRQTHRSVYVHRYSFQLTGGVIPPGMEIDHLCHQPSCCNPAHLRVVTHKENSQTGRWVRKKSTKTDPIVCSHGHSLTNENIYTNPKGERQCRQCKRESFRRWRATHQEHHKELQHAWWFKNRENINPRRNEERRARRAAQRELHKQREGAEMEAGV